MSRYKDFISYSIWKFVGLSIALFGVFEYNLIIIALGAIIILLDFIYDSLQELLELILEKIK